MNAGFDQLFFDGTCGLCHRLVNFILNRGEAGLCFRFAALQSEAFRRRISEERQSSLPDSVVILTAQGDVLMRSRAVLHILYRLGGAWRLVGWLGLILPRFLADVLYDVIARNRSRVFKRPEALCPALTLEQLKRFDP